MTETARKTQPSMARLTIVLFVITAITALLLAAVNFITADRIKEINEQKTKDAMSEVVPAAANGVEQISGGEAGTLVRGIYVAGSDYIVQVAPSGFGGEINMVVGIDAGGTVLGVSIINMAETAGLGDNAASADYRAQYAGASGTVKLTKDGGEIDALTGATVTSRAVTNGVNAALEAVAALG